MWPHCPSPFCSVGYCCGQTHRRQQHAASKVAETAHATTPSICTASDTPPQAKHNTAPKVTETTPTSYCGSDRGVALAGAMKQRTLSYRTPPCHRRPVTAHQCSAALRHLQTSRRGRGGGGTSVGAFSHSAGTVPIITVSIPGTPPANHPPTEACVVHSKQHRGRRLQDPGTRGYRWWKTADFLHSAQCTPSGCSRMSPPFV